MIHISTLSPQSKAVALEEKLVRLNLEHHKSSRNDPGYRQQVASDVPNSRLPAAKWAAQGRCISKQQTRARY